MYQAYITKIENLRRHPNADRLQLGECFGNTVCVSSDYINNQMGVYFPTDGQLSEEFATQNNLIRKKDVNGNNVGGYMDPDKRNVTTIKLRGEKSDGLFLPITCLKYTGVKIETLKVGDTITVVNGHDICCKYIPKTNYNSTQVSTKSTTKKGKKSKQKHVVISPLFMEHSETSQLAYNQQAFKAGDDIEITLKMHGTSQRTAYVPVFKGYKRRNLVEILTGKKKQPIYKYDYISGTRRTIIDTDKSGGFYGSHEFREVHSNKFKDKLMKGETVYYEVVGFTNTGTPIMGDASNKKTNDKEFIKQYGETTRFSYGCSATGEFNDEAEENKLGDLPNLPKSDMYVYRMTITNEDGFVVEYSPEFMRYRCEQIGVKTVPVMIRFRIPVDCATPGEYVRNIAEQYYDGPDPIGKTHIREGVVCRITNRPNFCSYKHKNFYFKVLENIIKVDATAPDMEEAQETEANG